MSYKVESTTDKDFKGGRLFTEAEVNKLLDDQVEATRQAVIKKRNELRMHITGYDDIAIRESRIRIEDDK